MTFHLSDEQELITRTVREFAASKVAPHAERADRGQEFPREALVAMKELGLLGMTLPAEEGGAGADNIAFALACEEIFRACASTGILFAATNCYLAEAIHRWGGPELKEGWLPRIVSGEAIGTIGLWEDHSGGRVSDVRTRAIRKGESEYLLRGTKGLVLGLGVADAAIVFARVMESEKEFPVSGSASGQKSTAPTAHSSPTQAPSGGSGRHGAPVTAFLVPIGKGTHWGTSESKMGLRGAPTGELYFTGAIAKRTHRLGEEGEADKVQRHLSSFFTLAIAAGAVGISKAALEASVGFANDRVQFGQPIARFEGIQHYVAEMRASIDAAAGLVYTAAGARDAGDDTFSALAEEAAAVAFDTGRRVTRLAHRVHGGAGFMREIPVERYSRDVRTLHAVGRSVDVLRTSVGRRVLAGGGALEE